MLKRAPLAAMIIAIAMTANARDIGLGTVELSGLGSMEFRSDRLFRYSTYALQPEAALYLSPFFNIGPTFGYTLYQTEDRGADMGYDLTTRYLDLGLKAGGLILYSQGLGRPLPFMGASAGGTWMRRENSGSESKEHGPVFKAMGGIKIKISESFLLAVFNEYAYRDVNNYTGSATAYRIGFGFSGIL